MTGEHHLKPFFTSNIFSLLKLEDQYTGCSNISLTKLLQKSEMRKEIVIELSYKGFSRASDYS